MVSGHHGHRDGGGPAAPVRHAPHAGPLPHSSQPTPTTQVKDSWPGGFETLEEIKIYPCVFIQG